MKNHSTISQSSLSALSQTVSSPKTSNSLISIDHSTTTSLSSNNGNSSTNSNSNVNSNVITIQVESNDIINIDKLLKKM